jgi:hypothetical protein
MPSTIQVLAIWKMSASASTMPTIAAWFRRSAASHVVDRFKGGKFREGRPLFLQVAPAG